jgi:hypothetical protein
MQKLTQFISLSVAFNINNTLQVIQNLEETSIDPNTRLASLDIRNIPYILESNPHPNLIRTFPSTTPCPRGD